MDDVIKLISSGTPTYDEYGNEQEADSPRQVFCQVRSVSRSEFYAAAQNNQQPSYIFTLSHYRDYQNERELLYTDWTGSEKRYTIVRTYRSGDSLELTAEEHIDDYGD